MRVFGHIVLLLSISLMAITMPTAFAGFPTAGSNPNAGGFQLILDLQADSGQVNIMEDIGACNPVSSCPPIIKNIDPQGQGSITLHEEWTNVGDIDWVDWHEVIQPTPGGVWSFTAVQIQLNCMGPMIDQSSSISPDGSAIWLDFSPIVKNEKLCIWKDVVFTPFNPQSTLPPDPLRIWEWPTIPEPVGGESIPIDTVAVLIAGVQTNALNLLAALTIIGAVAFGALYASVKRK